jgi:hypothetical protein
VRLLKTGFYDFDADRNQVLVLDGKAVVRVDGMRIKVKGGHKVNLDSTGSIKAQKFDKRAFDQDRLDRWSILRSADLERKRTRMRHRGT